MNFKLALLASAMALSSSFAMAQQRPRVTADTLNAQQLELIRADSFDRPQTPAGRDPDVVTPVPSNLTLSGLYVGANAGSTFENNSDYTVGLSVGYQFTPNFGAEVTYDYNQRSNDSGQLAMVNGVAGLPLFNGRVTPYALAGVGAGFDYFGNRNNSNDTEMMYNVGGGVRFNVVGGLDLDVRYRYVGSFDSTGRDANLVTGGVNYRF